MGNRLDHSGCKRLKDDEETKASRAIGYPPAFNRCKPAKWFAEIEEHFEEFHIETEEAKCKLLIDLLDWDLVQLINDLVLCTSTTYESLKGVILKTLNNREKKYK